MHYLSVLMLLFFINHGNVFAQLSDMNSMPSTPVKIIQAHSNNHINLDQKIIYLAYYLKSYEKIPIEFKSKTPEKCSTWILDEINTDYSNLSDSAKSIIDTMGIPILKPRKIKN